MNYNVNLFNDGLGVCWAETESGFGNVTGDGYNTPFESTKPLAVLAQPDRQPGSDGISRAAGPGMRQDYAVNISLLLNENRNKSTTH